MLRSLKIKNYALIELLDLHFESGLTIITGETGAGKSILLGALGLILGQRADTQVLLHKSGKCVIEGEFDLKNLGLEPFFVSHDLDFDANSMIRREINVQGKSRAFINDTPVTLNILAELGEQLVDIHSQHQTRTLGDSAFQLQVVDCVAGQLEQARQYEKAYLKYQEKSKELTLLKEEERKALADRDYYQFLFDELEQAGLAGVDQNAMEQELELLNNAEEIKRGLAEVSAWLDEQENAVSSQLKSAINALNKFSGLNQHIHELAERLDSCRIELADISAELDQTQQSLVYDPQQIELLTDRLNDLYHLQNKHHVATVNALLDIQDELSERLHNITSVGEQIGRLEVDLNDCTQQLQAQAAKLSIQREKAIVPMQDSIQNMLKTLGIPDARIEIEQEKKKAVGMHGYDQIRILFSANKGVPTMPLSKVASGGELSRVMLCIKSLVAQKSILPTIIFDEIDTGVSGDIAGRVGEIMKKMAAQLQLIVITHQPLIAGKGDVHYNVFKSVSGDKTVTAVKKLSEAERVEEIAKMLGGGNISRAVTDTAKELLK